MAFTITSMTAETRANDPLGSVNDVDPSIAPLAWDGGNVGYVLAWISDGGGGIVYRRFDKFGSAIDPSQKLVSGVFLGSAGVEVTGLPGGGFVVTWVDPSGNAIRQRGFDANGNGGLEKVIATSPAPIGDVSVTALNPSLGNGAYVVCWSTSPDGDSDTYYRRFDANGNALGASASPINTPNTSNDVLPVVAQLPHGDLNPGGALVFTWMANEPGEGDYDIYQTMVGGPGGFDSRVNVDNEDGEEAPAVAALPGGGYVVVWVSNKDGDDDIYMRRFNANGLPTSAEILVNDDNSTVDYDPKISVSSDGRYTVIWTSNQGAGGVEDIYSKTFTADGVAIGGAEMLVHLPNGYQDMSAVSTFLADGTFVAAWETYRNEASGTDIYQRVDGPSAGLTTGTDTAVGTALDETLTATAIQLTFADVYDGGGGSDTLVLDNGGEFDFTGATIKNFESIKLVSTQGTKITTDDLLIAFLSQANMAGNDEINFTGGVLTPELRVLLSQHGFEIITDLAGSVSKPTDVLLTAASVRELASPDAPVGILSGVGAVPGSTFKLISDAGGRFEIKGSALVVKNGVALDYEQAKSHVIKVEVNSGGLTYVKDFTVAVTNQAVEVTAGSVLNDTVIAANGRDNLRGGLGHDTLKGMGNNDVLRGDANNDRLFGGLGKDTLFGGLNKDVFVFDSKLSTANVDVVKDFKVRDDSIWLDNAIMKEIGSGTVLRPVKMAAKFLHIGPEAHDGDDRIIYNKGNGKLYYDADGDGGGVQVQIALLAKNLKLTSADFFIV